MGLKVAVFGATGAVGKEMLTILAERLFPADEVFPLASRKSMGVELSYGDRTLVCQNAETFDFSKVDLVLMSAGGDPSREWSPKIAAAGAIVIDNSSAWRMDPDVPLVVPEVNPEALDGVSRKGIIANPNCSTIQLMVALKPIHDRAKIKRVNCATYQSVSGGGQAAMDELWTQTKGIYVNDEVEPQAFTKQIAFNVIPHIDTFMEDGATKEEWKMTVETKKILDPSIQLHATCVRVPVFISHAVSANVEMEEHVSVEEAREAFSNQEGCVVVDYRQDEGYVTPKEAAGEDAVYVSRIREDITAENGLAFWCVSDNLRKGAALNAVQIAEKLIEMKII